MTNEGWVRAHDKYQIEIKLGYDLRPHHRRDNYRVDTYFFLPENLDVNESTYTKDRFYRDLILYIRFRTPEFTLTTLTDPGSERSPLSRVVRGLENGLAAPTPKIIAGLDYEMRLLGCVVKNTLRAQTRAIAKLLPPIAAPQMVAQASALLDEYLVESQRLIQRYRELRARVADPGLPAGLSAVYHYTDEYISLLIEDRSQDLLSLLQQRGDPRHAGHIQSLIDLIGAEINHRKLVQLPSLVEASGDNETFVFRLSVLKKYMASALRLSVETRDERGGLEHMVLALRGRGGHAVRHHHRLLLPAGVRNPLLGFCGSWWSATCSRTDSKRSPNPGCTAGFRKDFTIKPPDCGTPSIKRPSAPAARP
ncbi:MAG: hypothetical protein IPH01_08320 [Elusimicrobia bacterium]|nr:hypothetical protein [Elusimicrobiota bacterium]